MNDKREETAEDRLVRAYERMMERTRALLEETRKETIPPLKQLIDEAEEKAVELGELTREEAGRINEYLRRDIEDAAEYLSYTGKGLAGWLNFDLDLVEARLMEMFSSMVDHTRLELDQLAERARRAGEVRTGEVAAPGTLRCTQCGNELYLHKTGHIPPCAKCHGTAFRRAGKG